MGVKRVLGGCSLAMLLSVMSFGAASDVADAVMRADKKALQSLLQQKADVNAPQADGTTALHWAVRADDLETARLLIAAGANAKASNRAGAKPLLLACINGNATMIESLLAAGEDPNSAVSELGDTALMLAARTGKPDAVRVLLDRGAKVDTREQLHGQTALMWAAADGHTATVRLLMERGANVNARSGSAGEVSAGNFDLGEETRTGKAGAMTPLLFAARLGSRDTVEALLAAGADINLAMANGISPMLLAIINGNVEVARILLEKGANPNATDDVGRGPLYAAVDLRNGETLHIPGPQVPSTEVLPLIKALLERGANPNTRLTAQPPMRGLNYYAWLNWSGATPFIRATQSGDVIAMRLLLAYGADPKIKLNDGTTALMAASGVGFAEGQSHEWPNKEKMEGLELVYSLGFDVNEAGIDGVTALHGAANQGFSGAVQFLVDHGARMDVKTTGLGRRGVDMIPAGLIPLDFAMGFKNKGNAPPAQPQTETVALLQKLMAAGTAAGVPVF